MGAGRETEVVVGVVVGWGGAGGVFCHRRWEERIALRGTLILHRKNEDRKLVIDL